ncbi:hypothetical protein BAE44_0008051, partial [Dichanthelium oligosanthes]
RHEGVQDPVAGARCRGARVEVGNGGGGQRASHAAQVVGVRGEGNARRRGRQLRGQCHGGVRAPRRRALAPDDQAKHVQGYLGLVKRVEEYLIAHPGEFA